MTTPGMRAWKLTNNDATATVRFDLCALVCDPNRRPELDLDGQEPVVTLAPGGGEVEFQANFVNELMEARLRDLATAHGVSVGKSGLHLVEMRAPGDTPPVLDMTPAPFQPQDPDVPIEPHLRPPTS